MSRANLSTLKRICESTESYDHAKELLNLAVAKTGPGSGHHLGANAVALPAICAYLASQRLGNTDVTEKIAQQASCIAPKAFNTTLVTVRNAIAEYLSEKHSDDVTPTSLVRSYGLDDKVIYWVEQVEKALKQSGRAAELQAELDVDAATMYVVMFYWACTVLHVRSVKMRDLMDEYNIPLGDMQDILHALDKTCTEVQERMDKEVGVSRSLSTSAIKRGDESPKKRAFDTSLLPKTPTKKQRIVGTSSLASASATATPQTRTYSTPSNVTPLRQYGSARSIRTSSISTATQSKEPSPSKSPSKSAAVTPRTRDVNERLNRLAIEDDEGSEDDDLPPSPTKGRTPKAAWAGSSKRASQTVLKTPRRRDADESDVGDSAMDLDALVATVDTAYEAQLANSRCPRHSRRPFADRDFYTRRDPRVAREWELCEDNFEVMVKTLGYPYGQPVSTS